MVVTSRRPILDIPYNDPFIELAKRSYKEIMGKDVRVAVCPGGSDAAWIYKVTKTPMPHYRGAEEFSDWAMAKPNERISLNAYFNFIKVYMMTVVNALS